MFKRTVVFLTSHPGCPGGIASVFRSIRLELFNSQILVFFTYDCDRKKINYLKKYLKFLIKIRKVEVVHLNTPLSFNSFFRDLPYTLITKLFRKKLIIHFHGGDEQFLKRLKSSKLLKTLASNSYFSADKIVLLGSIFKSKYSEIKEIDKEKFIVLPNPIEDIFLLQKPKILRETQKKINVMYLARIDHKKGCEIAIKAFAQAQLTLGKGYKLNLNISGDGPLLSQMIELVKNLGIENVHFHGYVKGEAKIHQYQYNDIFLYPTYYGEGLPVCILEAMAFGLPVITRNEGGIKDWVENNSNGFVTNSLNPTDFGKILVDLIGSPIDYNRISKNNISKANTHFSPKSIVVNYLNIYKSLGRA